MPMSSPVWEPVLQNITPETTPWWLGVTVAIASGKDMGLMETKKVTWSVYILFWVVLSWYFCILCFGCFFFFILYSLLYLLDFPRSSVSKELTCNAGDCLQYSGPGFSPWIGKILWRGKWQPTLVFLPGKSHGQRSLAGCVTRVSGPHGARLRAQACSGGWFLLR